MDNLGVFVDDISQDLEHALGVVQDLGVRWVEIRSAWGKNLVDHDGEAVREIRRAIHGRGLRVRCIAAPFLKSRLRGRGEASKETFHTQTRDDMAQQMEVLRRAIEIAREFDTSIVRCFSFWKVGDDPAGVWDELLEEFAEPVKLAEQEGIVLAMENDFECNLGTGVQTARFVEQVGSPSLRILWDPGNAYFSGEDEPYPVGYERARDLIVHVHLKDALCGPIAGSVQWVELGAGEVDLLGQLRALKADGYTGVMVVENHYVPEGGTKEDGVRASFAGLRRIIEQVG